MGTSAPGGSGPSKAAARALRLVLILGVVSLFADTTYEGARSVAGPFLQSLGANSLEIGLVVGLGELASYGLRPFSGRLTDRLRRPWLIAIPGYLVNLLVVPALALAGSWPVAALLFVLERIGKGVRNPPRDTMLSYAGGKIGAGWAFGLHEALDQTGAVAGPLAIAVVLALGGGYRTGFAYLLLPAIASLGLLALARWTFPTPHDLEPGPHRGGTIATGQFRLLTTGAAFLAAGVVAFPLISFFFVTHGTLPTPLVPALYAVGMAAEGLSALALGRLFDRLRERTLLIATALAALSAPLLFTTVPALEFAGMGFWGIGMGAQVSVLNAVVTHAVPKERRAVAFGEIQAALGVAGFGSGVVLGALLGVSVPAVVAFAVLLEIAALICFLRLGRASVSEPPTGVPAVA